MYIYSFTLSALTALLTFSAAPVAAGGSGSSEVQTILNAMGVDQIRGVNLGGWLLLEKWITDGTPTNPFSGDENAPDEWSLHSSVPKSKMTSLLNNHYDKFVTRAQIKQLASSGINLVRIPIGHWILPEFVNSNEPWAPNDGWKYLLRVIKWCQASNLYVLVDLHGAPGSQAYQQTTGHQSTNEFWNGGVGGNNMQRSIKLIAKLADTFSKSPYKGTVVGLELLNEPQVGQDYDQFLKDGYAAIRKAEKANGVTCKGSNQKRDIIEPGAFYHEHTKRHCSSHKHGKQNGHGHNHGHSHKHGHNHHKSRYTKKGHKGKHSHSKNSTHHHHPSPHGKGGKYKDCMWIASMYKDGMMDNNQYPRIVNDIHQYQVFTDQDNALSAQGHIDTSCGLASQTSGSQNPALIGEWSGAANVGNQNDEYQKKYYSAQMNSYENGGLGWVFWNFYHPHITEWSFLGSLEKGWLIMDPSKRPKTC